MLFSFLTYYSGLLLIFLRFFLRKGLYVFNYHSFNTFINDYWKFGSLYESNYKERFEKQIRFFNKYFKKIKNFELSKDSYKEPTYLLTFDDGYRDNFYIGLPLLRKYSVPSVFFIATGVINTKDLLWHDEVRLVYENNDKKNILHSMSLKSQCKKKLQELKQQGAKEFKRKINGLKKVHNPNLRLMMNWNEIKKASGHNILIGSHTHTHPVMTKLNFDEQLRELERSIKMIKNKLGYYPAFFSYPSGASDTYSQETIDILKKFGIRYSFTTDKGINNEITSPYCLKRIGINPSDPIPIVGLKIININLKNILKRKIIEEIGPKVRQFGVFNFLKRVIKKLLRTIGIFFDSYYVLYRELEKPIESFDTSEKIEVKEINYKDFEQSEFYNLYPRNKRDLYKGRFSSDDYQAFGVRINSKLVYMTWIATDFIEIKRIHFEQKLKKGEGILVDSYALPEARRLGIHKFMNGYRLQKLRDKGVKKVYAAVVAENKPALTTQIRHGFTQGERITWIKFGRLEKYFKKEVNF